MSVVKSNALQLGQSLTATNNGTWYQPATPDGTIRYGIGNAGATTSDVVTLTSAGNVGIGTSSPTARIHAVTSAGNIIQLNSTNANGGYATFQTSGASVGYLGTAAQLASGSVSDFCLRSEANLVFSVSSSEKMRLDSSGNLGLGVTPSAWYSSWKALELSGGAVSAIGAGYLQITQNAFVNASGSWAYKNTAQASRYDQTSGQHQWFTAPSGTAGNAISFTQAMTLDASSRLLVNTTTSLLTGSHNIVGTAASDYLMGFASTFGTASQNYGLRVTYTAAAPNGTGNPFLYASDSAALRAEIRSNGGLANFSANNVNLSDERVKTAITPAPSWLAKINAIEVVNFKYKDQTHDDPNLGVIAQQVLSVAPELVDEEGFGETPEDGVPLMAIFETDLKYAMLKAIQELSAELNELKAKVNA